MHECRQKSSKPHADVDICRARWVKAQGRSPEMPGIPKNKPSPPDAGRRLEGRPPD